MDLIENSMRKSSLIVGTFFIAHALGALIKRQGYLLSFVKYSRVLSFPVTYVGWVKVQHNFAEQVKKDDLEEYMIKRVNYRKHMGILKRTFKLYRETAQANIKLKEKDYGSFKKDNDGDNLAI